MSDEELAALLPPIAHDANKYTRGSLLVLAGSARFTGAAVLAAQAAARTGAGYVTLAIPQPAAPVAQGHLLSTAVLAAPAAGGAFAADAWMTIKAQLTKVDAIVLGPGITVTEASREFVRCVVEDARATDVALLVDADGINCLAALLAEGRLVGGGAGAGGAGADGAGAGAGAGECAGGDSRGGFKDDGTPRFIVTPHSGELKRLLAGAGALSMGQLAEMLECVVVAKGPVTQVLGAGRHVSSGTGTAALARAGTGDVLAGVIGALLAQGMGAFDAACVGVELHSRAGLLAQGALGLRSVCAEDVVASIAAVLKAVEGHV